MTINWESLRHFLEATRHTTLAEAARRLHIDATTLGRRLRRFEQEIGTEIFERTPQGIRLTDAGRTLAAYVEQMEDSSAKAMEAIQGIADGVRGTVRISAAEGFGSFILAPALTEFSRSNPQLQIDLIATSGFLSVSKREADIAVLLSRPEAGRLFTQKLNNYTLMLYASRDYIATHPPISSISDISGHCLIGYVDDLIYSSKLRYIDEIPNLSPPTIRISNIIGQYHATKAGAGLCILPCFIADQDDNLVRILPDQIKIERKFWLAVHEDIRNFSRIKATLDFLKATGIKHSHLLLGVPERTTKTRSK